MRQSEITSRFVQAFLLGDIENALSIHGEMPSDHPDFKVCDAIAAAALLVRGSGDAESVNKKLRLAQEPPPVDVRLMTALLIATLGCAKGARVGNAGRTLRALKELVTPGGEVVLQAQALVCEAHVWNVLGEHARAHEAVKRACSLQIPRGCGLWHSTRLALCLIGMQNNDFDAVERGFAELSSCPPSDEHLRAEFDMRKLRWLALNGQAREGLAMLERVPVPAFTNARLRLLHYRVRLLLSAGCFAEAAAAVEASVDVQDRPFTEFLRARICHLNGDVQGVRDHVRRALTMAPASPLFIRDNGTVLAAAELQAGQANQARRLLRMVDPEQTDVDCAILWAWLLLLENNLPQAARQFRRVLDLKDWRIIREQLRYANGLTAGQICMLWTLADDLDAVDAAPPAPAPRTPEAAGSGGAELLGDSPAMAAVRASIERFAALSETVLVTGETGTGKELVARLLHAQSPRAKEPFIAVNCAAVSDTLIESELFGHVKGAFTGATSDNKGLFASAGEGTIFLDEISSMSPRLQAALLRVLENGEIRPVGASRSRRVRARVIAASNQPLEEMVERQEFRADLYYRLARLHVRLPPLRERIDDIPMLVRHFLQKTFDYGQVALGDDLLRAMQAHDWPGNVRELQNEVGRIAILSGGRQVLGADLFRSTGLEPERPAATMVVPAASPAGQTPTAAPAPGAGRRLRDRLGRLRELFRERRELSRVEVIGLLGCSPNTATRYLKTLEGEGLIRRVHTSAALHTSYFELCG